MALPNKSSSTTRTGCGWLRLAKACSSRPSRISGRPPPTVQPTLMNPATLPPKRQTKSKAAKVSPMPLQTIPIGVLAFFLLRSPLVELLL